LELESAQLHRSGGGAERRNRFMTQLQIAKDELNKKLCEAMADFESKTGLIVTAIDVAKTKASRDDAITTKQN